MDSNQGNAAAEFSAIKPLPTVGAVYGHGWRSVFSGDTLSLFVVVVIGLAISSVASLLDAVPSFLFAILIETPIVYGLAYVYLRAVRQEEVGIEQMFAPFKQFADVVLSGTLVTIFIVLGFVLLIVPGIIIGCRLAFVPYLIMDKKLKTVPAMKESWELTRGHSWRIFGMYLLAIPIIILGLICFVVGILVSFMWMYAAFASMYFAITGAPPVENSEQDPIVP